MAKCSADRLDRPLSIEILKLSKWGMPIEPLTVLSDGRLGFGSASTIWHGYLL